MNAQQLARAIDASPRGEVEIDALDELGQGGDTHAALVAALQAGVLELVRRGEEEWVRRPLDARLLDVLDRRGRRRGLRWQTLERLLHQRAALPLALALGRQVEAGRVERWQGRYRRARPPPRKWRLSLRPRLSGQPETGGSWR